MGVFLEHRDARKDWSKHHAGWIERDSSQVSWASAKHSVPYVLWLHARFRPAFTCDPQCSLILRRAPLQRSADYKVAWHGGANSRLTLLAAQDDNPGDTVLVDVVNGQCFNQPPTLATSFSSSERGRGRSWWQWKKRVCRHAKFQGTIAQAALDRTSLRNPRPDFSGRF